MKLPAKQTRMRKILEVLCTHEPVTFEEGVKLHGAFSGSRAQVAADYEKLVVGDFLRCDAGYYAVTVPALALLQTPKGVNRGPLVPPREINNFPAPLNPRYFISAQGNREGSNDLRACPSVNAPIIR